MDLRDHEDTALELLDRRGKSAERVAVEEVGGLVQDDDVGQVPETSTYRVTLVTVAKYTYIYVHEI